MNEEIKNKIRQAQDKPTDWFETLYSNSNEVGDGVPWANMSTHPIFDVWLKDNKLDGTGKSALVVGCGMGDDAITLEKLGFEVTAFDVSESAIDLCKKRFPNSTVEFVQADLLAGIPEWKNKFDFILEIYTVQALPPNFEKTAIDNISELVATSGELMVITEVQKANRVFEVGPPWLLNSDYVDSFEKNGLTKKTQLINTDSDFGDESHLTIFKK